MRVCLSSLWLLGSWRRPACRRRKRMSGLERLEERVLLTTIFSEDFEGAFPGSSWTLNTSQSRTWDDSNDRSHGGSWSGYCADLTAGTDQTSYVNSMTTTMTRTVDLTNFRNVSLSYWRYVYTESGFDGLRVTVSKGSDAITTTLLSGDHRSWIQDTLDVPNYLWGQSGVTVKFSFSSDSSSVPSAPSGVWLDDIVLTGISDPGFPPETITPESGTHVRLNQFGDIVNLSASITSASNYDVYGFGVDVTGSYTISAGGAVDTQLRVYNSVGDPITGIIDNTNGTESTTVSLNAGTTCYFVVAGYISATGAYTVDVNGPSSSPLSVSLSPYEFFDSRSGNAIDFAGDRDYWTFTAPAGTTSLTLTVSPSANLDPYLTLLSSSGAILTTRDSGGVGSTETLSSFATTPGQTYVMMVSGYSLAEGGSGDESYSWTLDFNPDDLGDPPSTLTNPESYTGFLLTNPQGMASLFEGGYIEAPNEFDVYPYYAQVTGQHTVIVDGSLDTFDTQLRVYDESGNDFAGGIIDNFGASGSELYSGTLTGGQWYYFAVAGYQLTTGAYDFSIQAPVETIVSIPTSGVARTGSVGGAVDEGGERDFYEIVVPMEATSMTIQVTPAAGLNTVFSVYDSAGEYLDFANEDADGATDSLTGPVVAGQTYCVSVFGDGRTDSGDYSVSVDFNPDLTGPKITKVEAVKDAKGKKVVGLILTFDKDLVLGTAQSISTNYILTARKGSKEVQVVITSAVYNNKRVTLTPLKAVPIKKLAGYTLRVRGNGSITDLVGGNLDGDANGVPGGDFIRLLSQAE